MRILNVTDTFFPRVNGVSTSIDIFRRQLGRMGHEVTVLAPRYGREPVGEGVFRAPARQVLCSPEDRLLRPMQTLRAEPILRRRGFELVHVQTPFSALTVGRRLARQWNVPVVLTHHTDFEQYLNHYLPGVGRGLYPLVRHWLRRRCDLAQAVIAPTPEVAETLNGYGVSSPVHVVPTGLPIAEFSSGDGRRFRAAHGIPEDVRVVGYVGRLAGEKNIPFLLEVFARVREARPTTLFLMAGEGPAEEQLRDSARRLGIADSVRWVGYLSRRNDLLDCYRALDAFLFASRTETQGLVLLEAMALGVPVVIAPAAGTRRVVSPGQGALVVPERVDVFADRVVSLLADETLQSELSRAGRSWVQRHWSAAAASETLANVYHQVIAASATAGSRTSSESPAVAGG